MGAWPLSAGRALLAIALGAVAVSAAGCGNSAGAAPDPHAGAARAHRALFVDGSSIGGRCDDSRAVGAVTRTTPWCSLGRAFADAPAGSIVYVRGGAYPRLVVGSFARGSTVTFTAFHGEHPVVDGIALGSGAATTRNLVLHGFKIVGYGVSLTNVADVRFAGNEIALTPVPPTGCPDACVVRTPTAMLLTPPASNLVIAHNYMHDGALGVGFRLGHPPSAPGSPVADTYRNIAIDHNTFADMGDVVLSIQNFEGVSVKGNVFANDFMRADIDPDCHCDSVHAIGGGDRLLLDGNLVFGGRGFLLQPGYPDGRNCEPRCLELTRASLQNNVLVGKDFGVRVLSSPGVRILNNTIWGSEIGTSMGLTFLPSSPRTTGAVVANNILRYFQADAGVRFAAETYNDVREGPAGPGYSRVGGAHDICAEPRFVSPGPPAWNYQLRPASPGAGAGSPAYVPPIDIPGWRLRSPPNLGAFGYELPRGGGRGWPFPSMGSRSPAPATVITVGALRPCAGRSPRR